MAKSINRSMPLTELDESQPTFLIPRILQLALYIRVIVPSFCFLNLANRETLPLMCFEHPLLRIHVLGTYKIVH